MPYTKCVPSHTLCQAFSSTSYVRAWGMGASSLFLSLKKTKTILQSKKELHFEITNMQMIITNCENALNLSMIRKKKTH